MKSSLTVSVLFIATLLLSFPVLQAVALPNKNQSFEQWCLQKDSLPVKTKRTVEVLLKESGTQDCKLADMKLKSWATLDLGKKQISDVKPLAGLTNLTSISLSNNQISDIKPLADLIKLNWLLLYKNQIIDINPLEGLINLTSLYLYKNQISDIKPIAGLTNLTSLWLGANQISDKSCPIKPESLCK